MKNDNLQLKNAKFQCVILCLCGIIMSKNVIYLFSIDY